MRSAGVAPELDLPGLFIDNLLSASPRIHGLYNGRAGVLFHGGAKAAYVRLDALGSSGRRRRFTEMTGDPKSIADALAYVTEVYRELAQENGAATLGTQSQMVEFVLDDDALLAAARHWAERTRQDEATLEPHERPPHDEAFRRVRARMLTTMEWPSKFGHAAPCEPRQ